MTLTGEATVRSNSKSRSVVYCAAAIACMTVTAWVTVPIGPVPLSLAPLGVYFTLFAVKPINAFVSICGYVLLGALGLPVFTGFRGGIGAVFGPTGGFIMGDVIGAFVALLVAVAIARQPIATSSRAISIFGNKVNQRFFYRNVVVGAVFTVVLYICGWFWLMLVGNLDAGAAFLAAVAPFIFPDVVKMILAIFLAQAVGVLTLSGR